MMLRLLFLFGLCCTTLYGQGDVFFQEDFYEGVCPYDSSQTGFYPRTYAFFITLDNTYDGVVDSSWCPVFSCEEGRPSRYRLELEDFDFNRKLFIRVLFTDPVAQPIRPSADYYLELDLWSEAVGLNPDSLCSHRILRYAAVANSGDTIARSFAFDLPDTYVEEAVDRCFFTENFESQWVTELGLSLCMQREGDMPWLSTYGFSMYNEEYLLSEEVTDITFPLSSLRDSVYIDDLWNIVTTVPSEEPGFLASYFLPQYNDRLPGPTAIRYTDVGVEGNPDTVVKMFIRQDRELSLQFPPFTGLRGAPVTGTDNLRHQLTLSYPEYYFASCFSFIVERPAPVGTFFEFGSDSLRFDGPEGCIYLDRKAGIILRPDSDLHYGSSGQGMLAVEPESKIIVGAGSSFNIGSTFRILNRPEEQVAHIYLEEGSVLSFGEHARAELKFPEEPGFIDVYNNGGALNFGPLTPAEQAFFRFIYPESDVEQRVVQDILAFPNPVKAGDRVGIQLPDTEMGERADYRLLSSTGQELLTGRVSLDSSPLIQLPATLAVGVYWLLVDGSDRRYQRRLLVH